MFSLSPLSYILYIESNVSYAPSLMSPSLMPPSLMSPSLMSPSLMPPLSHAPLSHVPPSSAHVPLSYVPAYWALIRVFPSYTAVQLPPTNQSGCIYAGNTLTGNEPFIDNLATAYMQSKCTISDRIYTQDNRRRGLRISIRKWYKQYYIYINYNNNIMMNKLKLQITEKDEYIKKLEMDLVQKDADLVQKDEKLKKLTDQIIESFKLLRVFHRFKPMKI